MAGPLTRLGLGDESPEQRNQRITAGVMASVYRQVPQSVLGSIFGGMALVAAFWHSSREGDELLQNELLIWFIGMLLESLLRLRAARAFRLDPEPAKRAKLWASRWVAIAVAAGLLWGAAGSVFFTPESPLLQLVLLAVVLGVAFGSLTLYAGYRRALFCFLPLAILPMIVRMVGLHDAAYYSAAIVLFAVFLFTLFFGRNFGETMSEAVRKNHENEVLVEQLMNEKRLAEEARRAAENAIRSKTQFFAAASHDLRQPLQAIGIYCSLLRKRAQGPLEPLTKNLSTAVESLSKLVEELLEISRLDSGAVQASKQIVDLNEVFSTLRQEFVPIAASKGLRFRERRARLYVETDPLLLQRVLRNLLSNAVRYATEGGVLLAARRRGGRASLEVWDTGPGIRREEFDRIFEEFYRGESSKTETSGGYGLGLSIVRRICSVLGHSLFVTSRPGSGTVFRVEIPLAPRPAKMRTRPVAATTSTVIPFPDHMIVVLEDNPEILTSLARLLGSWGARVLPSPKFDSVLMQRLTSEPKIDLIIADHNLGGPINGAEAVLRIRELVSHPVPVVMLTAVPAHEVIAEFKRLLQARTIAEPSIATNISRRRGEEPVVLQKPADASLLNSTIAQALGLVPSTGADRPATSPV
ncbi:MAG TPA: hybrid sensor histidine kinase/response regulator [Burkholderiaceae bacterium]|nr:hybrid sensor histidine kinase/response regulator [Burkholderiaceae bacterium]